MKTKLLALFCIALFSANAQAQNGRLSLGLELAIPLGDFADQSNVGLGGTLRYEHPLGDNLSFTGTAGVISFGGDEREYGIPDVFEYRVTTNSMMIPIQVGLKYYTMGMMQNFYVGLETGVHVTTYDVETETIINGSHDKTSDTNSDTHFGFAPGIGFHVTNFDIGLRYQLLFVTATVTSTDPISQQTTTEEKNTTYSYLGLRLAYVFGAK